MIHHRTLLEAFTTHRKYAANKEEKAETFADAAYWQGVQHGMNEAERIVNTAKAMWDVGLAGKN
jgi:hypothetical protein